MSFQVIYILAKAEIADIAGVFQVIYILVKAEIPDIAWHFSRHINGCQLDIAKKADI